MYSKFLLLLLGTSIAQQANNTEPIKIEAEVAQTYSFDAEKHFKTVDAKIKKMQMDSYFN